MAIDALSLPYDITWQRVAWSADMLDRGYDSELPPKWRSSIAAYAYAIPLAETAEDYPDHRVVYLKVSASITGWSPRESLGEYLRIRDPEMSDPDNPGDGYEGGGGGGGGGGTPPDEDEVQQEGWDNVDGAGAVSRNYWPCGAALLQISVFPNPEAGVSDNDYPSIIDFEPKKRELYEAVTSTNEMLSGSSGNTNTRKGGTTTESLEASISTRVSIPLVGGSDISVTGRYSQEDVDITTTDASTERRETAGRSTQLSQLYQLFNGYHLGTNRAVFISFPRPHNVSSSDQMDNNLVSGERGLEGVQDVFLIVLVPKTVPGFCVRAGLDTSHKTQLASGGVRYVTPRRVVRGCGAFQDDRIVPVAPSVVTPPPRPLIVDDGDVLGWVDSLVPQMKSGRAGRIAAADTLNLGMADLRKSVLGNLAAGKYRARPFASTETFQQIVALEMRASKLSLDKLVTLNYITAAEKAALTNIAIGDVAQLFAELDPAKVSALAADIRARVVAAIASKALPSKT